MCVIVQKDYRIVPRRIVCDSNVDGCISDDLPLLFFMFPASFASIGYQGGFHVVVPGTW